MDPVDFAGYIIMFLFGLGVLGIYQYNKSRARILPLSVQRYGKLILEILIKKQQGRTKHLLVRVSALETVEVTGMYVELIGKDRAIHKLGFAERDLSEERTTEAFPGKPVEIVIPLTEFKNYLYSGEIPFQTFRFVVMALPNSKFKSHELAFNKNWNIYKPDSGRYN